MRETSIEARLVREVCRLGGRCEKWGRYGWPDRIILWPGGRVDFVETKAPGEQLRPLQEKRARQLRMVGFKVLRLDSPQAVDDYVRGVEQREST
jgi:hypothetical protein